MLQVSLSLRRYVCDFFFFAGFRHAWTVLRQWELRRHSSGRPGPLAAYNELVKKAELKPGDLAQVRSQLSFLSLYF